MIYIVEDDASIRELEQYALQTNQYTVRGFEDGASFWAAVRETVPDLVILDVMLPDEDGYQILGRLRETAATRTVPVIMVTAKTSEIDVVKGLDHGADDYLCKPFGIMEFISRVKAAGSSSTDTVISVFSSLAMALGLVILSRGGGFARYSSYLVGDILAITPADLGLLALTLAAVLVLWIVLFNPLLLTSVNPSLAASRGARVKWVEMAFIVAVAVVVMLSIQWVGILMINALLILPAASARNVARSARQYTLLSLAFSLFSGLLGLVLSYLWDVSAGPMIVLILGCIFAVTYLIKARSRVSRAA